MLQIHSEYVILITFPQQLWLRERASLLRYTFIASLVYLFSLFQEHNYGAIKDVALHIFP
jgi:hypothetical protein